MPPNLLHEVLNGALLGRRHAEALQRGGGGGEGGGGQAGDMGEAVKIMLTLIIFIIYTGMSSSSSFVDIIRSMAYFDDFPCEADILENQGRYKLVYFHLFSYIIVKMLFRVS